MKISELAGCVVLFSVAVLSPKNVWASEVVGGGSSTEWPAGSSVAIQARLNGKCIDVPQARFVAGTALQMWDCQAGSPAQRFEFSPEHQIRIGGLCLNAYGGAGRAGDTIGLWHCVGAANEKWNLIKGRLIGINGRCINISGANTSNGASVILWDCVDGAPNEIWNIGGATDPGDAGNSVTPPATATQPSPWVPRSFSGNYLPLANEAEFWSAPKQFKVSTGQMTVQSRFIEQHGTTCKIQVQFNNVGTTELDEKILINRPGKVAVGSNDFPLRAKLKPGTSVAYGTEIRECPLIWGKSKDMTKCASCEPLVYFVSQ